MSSRWGKNHPQLRAEGYIDTEKGYTGYRKGSWYHTGPSSQSTKIDKKRSTICGALIWEADFLSLIAAKQIAGAYKRRVALQVLHSNTPPPQRAAPKPAGSWKPRACSAQTLASWETGWRSENRAGQGQTQQEPAADSTPRFWGYGESLPSSELFLGSCLWEIIRDMHKDSWIKILTSAFLIIKRLKS